MPAIPDPFFQPTPDDVALVAAPREGDERAFAAIVEELNGPLLRLARMCVATVGCCGGGGPGTWLGRRLPGRSRRLTSGRSRRRAREV